MVIKHVNIGGDIMTLRDAADVADAIAYLREAGMCQARVWFGGPEVSRPANELLTTSGLIKVSAECFGRTRDQ